MTNTNTAPPTVKRSNPAGRTLFLVLTGGCFVYLYYRLNGAATREGMTLAVYMTDVFATVQWLPWLALMMAYSSFYFLIDTLVVTRALNWFIKDIRYQDILPIRASTYIISVFNEQIGKGAMAYYLNRRDQVVLALWILYFQGAILATNTFRDKKIVHAFKMATIKHYALFFLLRSPALLAAVLVYTFALRLFGVDASFLSLLGYLPVIFFSAAVPTPMRAAAITFWVILFPENEGQMAAFGFVQHNFFIFFNALIGLLFWRRAQRDLFG